jgi:hypothetical protein
MNSVEQDRIFQPRAALAGYQRENVFGNQQLIDRALPKDLYPDKLRRNENRVNAVPPNASDALHAGQNLPVAPNDATVIPNLCNRTSRFTSAEHVAVVCDLVMNGDRGIAIDASPLYQLKRGCRQTDSPQRENFCPGKLT